MCPQFDERIYQANLEALRQQFPSIHQDLKDREFSFPLPIDIFINSKNQPNATVALPDKSKLRLYESDDILGDMSEKVGQWILGPTDFLVCVGFGLGYVALTASKTFSENLQIVIIEPNVEMFDLAIRLVDLRSLFNHDNVNLFISNTHSVKNIFAYYQNHIPLGTTKIPIFGPSRLIFGEKFIRLEKEVHENIMVVKSISHTAIQYATINFENVMANLPSLLAGPDLGALKGKFSGIPAICVAAGPSLDRDISYLKSIEDRALIICGDSAAHALVEAEIKPHFVVTTDCNAINFDKLRNDLYPLRDSILLFSIESNPDNVGAFLSRKRLAVTARNQVLNNWLGPEWDLDWQIPAMTSVSHTAIFTAMALGADPIVMVGMDFAASCGKSHASGSVFRYGLSKESVKPVEGVRGNNALSVAQLIADRRQIENVIEGASVRFIDCSLDGALIQGTEHRSLSEIIDTVLQSDTNVAKIINHIDWSGPVEAHCLIQVFEGMQASVNEFCNACQQMVNKCQQAKRSNQKKQSRQLSSIAGQLVCIEKKYELIMRLLYQLRYEDELTLNRHLKEIQSENDKAVNPEDLVLNELKLLGNHFKSLKRAGVLFSERLTERLDFFVFENTITGRIDEVPLDVKPYRELLLTYLKENQLWRVEQLLQDHSGIFQNNPELLLEIVDTYAQRSMWLPALHHLKRIKAISPSQPKAMSIEGSITAAIEAVLERSLAAWQTGQVENARRSLIEFMSVYPSHPEALMLKKKLELYDQEKAVKVIQENQSDRSAENRIALETMVNKLNAQGFSERTIGILEGLANDYAEENVNYREMIGDVRLDQQDHLSAFWHYNKALVESPDDRTLRTKIENTLQYLSEDFQQVEMFSCVPKTCINRQTNGTMSASAKQLYHQVQPDIKERRFEDAIKKLERLVAFFPHFALAHNDLGVLYANVDNSDKALEHYLKATHLEPGNTTFFKNLADFQYVVLGRAQEALEIYVQLLKIDPTDMEVLLALSHVCAAQDRPDDARQFLTHILEIDPDHHEARQFMSQLLGGPPADEKSNRCEAVATYPSTLIEREIKAPDRVFKIKIPEAEVFRIDAIFQKDEYAINIANNDFFKSHIVVDIGANIGLFAIYIKANYPNANIHCFEPCPQTQLLFRENTAGLSGIDFYPFGLFNSSISTLMNLHDQNTGENSIKRSSRSYNDSVEIRLHDTGQQIDALGLNHIDILKIDTEGCEVEILESLGNRLDQVDYILLEYHTEKERRKIDRLLENFAVFGSKAVGLGIGTVKYVHTRLC